MNHPSRDSALQVWIDWLLSLHAQEIDMGLERVSQVASKLNVSRPAPFVVSVAGTNGKGSSVAMLTSILHVSDYKVGTYTSPHILRYNERIQINGQMVSDQTIVDAFYDIERSRGEVKLTYFEFSTLAALLIFKQQAVDVAVLEVGLGGRLDAVNLVDADATLICAIDVDHVEWLGSDRSVIATEKAGITRPEKPAVCSDPNPPQSLPDYALEHNVPMCFLEQDFFYKKRSQDSQGNESGWCISWDTGCSFLNWPEINGETIPVPALKGEFQLQNAAGVLALLATIQNRLPVAYDSVCQGLHSVVHPGRLQPLRINQQAWLVDVAHNPQSAGVLAEYLAEQAAEPYQAIFSVLNDKDSLPMVTLLKPFVKKWFIADLAIPRSTTRNQLTDLLLCAGINEDHIVSLDSMDACVNETAKEPETPVLVWGSFFTVSQTISALTNRNWL